MTTSEQAREWAKAEAHARMRPGATSYGFQQGILHVLSLLESETAVEAGARATFEAGVGDYSWAEMVRDDPSRADLWRDDFRAEIAAAVAAIIEGGSDDHE